MNIKFPYEKVEKGERVLIYGSGILGQKLFWEIRSGRYCSLAGVTDWNFDDNVQMPFVPVSKLSSVEFDKVIIATTTPEVNDKIKATLLGQNVSEEKIISGYLFDDFEAEMVNDAVDFPKHYNFLREVMEIAATSKSQFAGNFIYQSFQKAGFDGKRDSAERLAAYRMEDYLDKESSVLDIGCNCGFLDLQIADFVGKITGVDVDNEMIRMGQFVSERLKIDNAEFICGNIFLKPLSEKFDAVCIFAIHHPVITYGGITEEDFAKTVMNHVKHGGYIFFESHGYHDNERDERYERLGDEFCKSGFRLMSYKYHYAKTYGNLNRDISVYKKVGS